MSFKQTYKGIESPLSQEQEFDVDLTPPSINSFRLNSNIPSFSKEESLKISGVGPVSQFVNVSGIKGFDNRRYKINRIYSITIADYDNFTV